MSVGLRRAMWGWASGVATMLIVVAARDKGWGAFDAWYVSGACGALAMFCRSAGADEAN